MRIITASIIYCSSHGIVYKEEWNNGLVFTITKLHLPFYAVFTSVSHCQPFSTRHSSFVSWTVSNQNDIVAFFSQTITVLTQMKTSCIQTIRVFTTVSHCQACSTSHCHVVHVNFKANEILQFYYTWILIIWLRILNRYQWIVPIPN